VTKPTFTCCRSVAEKDPIADPDTADILVKPGCADANLPLQSATESGAARRTTFFWKFHPE